MKSNRDHIHCPLVQPESAGPLGCQDSASPDNNRVPFFTPGTMGINDKYSSGEPPESVRIMLSRLNNAWDALEDSRENVFSVFQDGILQGKDENQEKMAEAWEKQQRIALNYFELMQDYLKNYYDPNANYGVYVRVLWLSQDDVLRQYIGDETPEQNEVIQLTVKLAALHCQKAFEHYQKTKDKESLFYFISLASEVQLFADHYYMELPFAVKSMLQRMANDKKPLTVEEAWQEFIRFLTTGVKPGTPLWMRELVKGIKPVDPIKEHFLRSKAMGEFDG